MIVCYLYVVMEFVHSYLSSLVVFWLVGWLPVTVMFQTTRTPSSWPCRKLILQVKCGLATNPHYDHKYIIT